MIVLPHSEILEIAGGDAVAFAHAQFCNDVAGLADGDAQLNGWLSAQGRVRALFHLLRIDATRLVLVLRGGSAAALADALRRFVLRARVDITAVDAWQVVGAYAAATAPFELWRHDERRLQLHPAGATTAATGDLAAQYAWALADIRDGLPRLPAGTLDQLLPTWLDFDRLGALSYRKGCYPGQEIAARLHYRGGGGKRMLVRVASTVALDAGAALRGDDDSDAGVLLDVAPSDRGHEALAVVIESRATPGTPLRSGAAPVEVLSAQWAERS